MLTIYIKSGWLYVHYTCSNLSGSAACFSGWLVILYKDLSYGSFYYLQTFIVPVTVRWCSLFWWLDVVLVLVSWPWELCLLFLSCIFWPVSLMQVGSDSADDYFYFILAPIFVRVGPISCQAAWWLVWVIGWYSWVGWYYELMVDWWLVWVKLILADSSSFWLIDF
jgi:hypothetical protein